MHFHYGRRCDRILLESMALYVLLALLLTPSYRFQINADGISYIGIAQKYAAGLLPDAINAYWGPLFSWLLVPFLLVGLPPLLAARVLLLLIGLATLWQAGRLICLLELKDPLHRAVMWTLPVLLIYFALTVISPDLLFLGLALGYFKILFIPGYDRRVVAGVVAGMYGGALYLAKSFGFPFFAAHLLLITVLFYRARRGLPTSKGVVRNGLLALAVFALISLLWSDVLTAKYGHWMIGSAGHINQAIVAPGMPGHPMHTRGLFPPPNPGAVSTWEDVTRIPVGKWSPLDSGGAFRHQLGLVLHNLHNSFVIFNEFSLFTPVVLILAVVFLWQQRRRILQEKMVWLMLTFFLLLAGYCTVLIEERYLWLDILLLLCAGALLIQWLEEKRQLGKVARLLVILFFFASFLRTPVIELIGQRGTGTELQALNARLAAYRLHGRIASDDHWTESLCLAFFNGWKYYGEQGKLNETEWQAALRENRIDYYLDWSPFTNNPGLQRLYPELTAGRLAELRIYQLSP